MREGDFMAVREDKTRITITISKDLKEALEAEAKAQHRTIGNYIEYLLIQRAKGK